MSGASSMERLVGPAYRIETARTVLRCFSPSDVDVVARAVAESLAHLRPWMTWAAHEPLPHAQRLEWLRTSRGHFDLGSDYTYGIFDPAERELWGSAGLKLGASVDERELGYWVHVAHIGKGLATEVALALTRVGFDVEDLDCIEVRCDPENHRSARVARKLGCAAPVLDPLSLPMPDGSKRDTHVYTLSRVEYANSPAREAPIRAFDVLGSPLL
ncbi:MAG: GNAT family N-acetyltransferase [Polyangiales bacterium]